MKSTKEMVEQLIDIKNEIAKLSEQRDEIENVLPKLVIYKNTDGTWTRFKKTDNIKELENKGSVWGMYSVKRNQTKIDILKNKPKELNKEK